MRALDDSVTCSCSPLSRASPGMSDGAPWTMQVPLIDTSLVLGAEDGNQFDVGLSSGSCCPPVGASGRAGRFQAASTVLARNDDVEAWDSATVTSSPARRSRGRLDVRVGRR